MGFFRFFIMLWVAIAFTTCSANNKSANGKHIINDSAGLQGDSHITSACKIILEYTPAPQIARPL